MINILHKCLISAEDLCDKLHTARGTGELDYPIIEAILYQLAVLDMIITDVIHGNDITAKIVSESEIRVTVSGKVSEEQYREITFENRKLRSKIEQLNHNCETHNDEIKRLDKIIDEQKETIRILRLAKDLNDTSNVWYWQGDGENFPDSLNCPVIIKPEILRKLLANSASQ